MSKFDRKVKRNKTIHSNFICLNCREKVKFYKDIAFEKEGSIVGKKNIVRYKNVYWCKNCGSLYEPKDKNDEEKQV